MLFRIRPMTHLAARLLLVGGLATLFAAAPIPQARAAGNPLIISEYLANPAGSDSPFEYVELVATQSIDFSVTHYSVVFSDNGLATANGWIEGNLITYGFNITSGSVKPGDVVYVGGSSMVPTGPKLRVLDTSAEPGDAFGAPDLTGVLGNGGLNADGIAVFSADVGSLTADTVPVDSVFFGTGIGTAVVDGGASGYQLASNDMYAGGKLQLDSALAPDPNSGIAVSATGTYDVATGSFSTPRSWAAGAPSDSITGITVKQPPVNQQITTSCPVGLFASPGTANSAVVSATDPDGIVGAPTLVSGAVTGITLSNAVAATTAGGTASATLNVAATTAPGVYNVKIGFSNNDATPQTAQCEVAVGVVVLKPSAYLPLVIKN